MARAVTLALLLVVWSSAGLAQVDYPPLSGRVVDRAEVLPPAAEDALGRKLAAQEQATSNQLVVATVPSLEGRDIESYANGLFRAWKLGQPERDNGVLLLVAPKEREVRIEVGYGLEGVLTDALASEIVRDRILPPFKQGDLPGGIEAGVDAIVAAIDGSYEAMPERQPKRQPQGRDFLPILLFILWGGFMFYRNRRRRRGRRIFGSPLGYGGYPPGRFHMGGFSGGFGGGFSGGGGSSGGGGASGRW